MALIIVNKRTRIKSVSAGRPHHHFVLQAFFSRDKHQPAGSDPMAHPHVEPRTRSTSSNSSPKAKRLKTCENCAHAKIKCVRSGASSVCDRCLRLAKECYYREARAKNYVNGRTTRIDVLEAKVSQLLTSSGAASTLGAGSSPHGDIIDKAVLSMEQANRLLHQYRTKMVPYFPFFVIPSRATAEEIRRDRPFVFLAILATASYESMPLQRRLECEMKEMLSQCMIFGRKITFDTLQGLLIYLAWSQYHARPRRYFQLLHLAVSVIVDFELDKPLASRSQISRLEVGSKSSRDIGSRWSWGEEEQRAVVACYYLSSSLSVLLQKTCAFVHTDYIIDCCRALSRDAEYASDRYLEHIIRLQAIFEKVDALSFRHASELHREGAGLEERIVQLQAELEAYRDALPCALEDDLLLFFKYHTANLYLCQILFFDHSAPTTTTTWTPSRLEILNNGLLTSRTSLHFFLSLPPRTEMSVTNSLWVQVGFTLVTATRLAVTAASAVSALSSEQPCSHANTSSNNATATIARTTTLSLLESLDMHSILCDTTVRLRGLVSSVADEKGDRDLWFHTDKWLQRVREWFERSYSGLSNGTVAHTDEMDPSRHAGGPGGPGPSHGSHTHGISAFSPVGVQQYAPFPGGYYDDANAMLFSGWFGFGPAMDDANLMWLGNMNA